MKLSQFETKIELHVLDRGYDYYVNQQVVALFKSGETYEALVQGSSDYNVEVTILNDEITDYECSCPFEGPICKHVVAVLYKIRKDQNSEVNVNANKQVIDYLNTLEKQDIIKWIGDKLIQSNELAQRWALTIPTNQTTEEVIRFATELINIDIMRLDRIKYQNEYDIGFIELDFATEHLVTILDQASQQRNPMTSLKLLLLLLKPIIEYQDFIPLSDTLTVLKDDIFDHIRSMIESDIDIENKLAIFSALDDFYRTNMADTNYFEDILTLMHITLKIIHTEADIVQFKQWISIFKTTHAMHSESYYQEAFIILEKHLIKQTQPVEQYLLFLSEHSLIKDCRNELIEYYQEQSDFKKAIELSKKGLQEDPKYAHLWSKHLYDLYTITKQVECAKEIAFSQILLGYHDYIGLYQSHFDKLSWDSELTRLIDYAILINHDHLYGALVRKYHRNQDVINYIRKHPSSIEIMIDYLKPDQIEQFEPLVKTQVFEILKNASNRRDYRHLKNQIEFYRNHYGDSRANQILQDIIENNPRKKALIETLS